MDNSLTPYSDALRDSLVNTKEIIATEFICDEVIKKYKRMKMISKRHRGNRKKRKIVFIYKEFKNKYLYSLSFKNKINHLRNI